ncbi:MAG: hypothetical protein ACKVQK_02925 [Burkholderiales bacterium]
MLKIFGGGKPDHPMSDLKEARKILDEIPANDAHKALEELGHWMDSLSSVEGFKPELRSQILCLTDDAAQVPLRKLIKEYLANARMSKFQEGRLWGSIHGYLRQAALAFSSCVEAYGSGAKGTEAYKGSIVLLCVRALRSLSLQMRWQYMRYGPFEESLWGSVAKVYALAENRKFARNKVVAYPAVPGESSPEQEFLRAVMLASSSPDSLLPVEIELAERLIAHFSASFTLVLEQQPDIAYWIDLATNHPPLRIARPPQRAPTLRFFAAGRAMQELDELITKVKSTNLVPSSVNLGGIYEPAMVLDVLRHLALYWSSKPPERKHPRHRVKTRLAVTHGLDGVLGALGASVSLDFEEVTTESWIVDNVSAGGFGASVPQIKGEWLKIGCILALQPEGGTNWVLGMVRRFNRESPQQGSVGIQTLARTMESVQLRAQGGADGGEICVLLDAQGVASAAEALVVMRAGVFIAGQNLEFESQGKQIMLMPQAVVERGDDYELAKFRVLLRDSE